MTGSENVSFRFSGHETFPCRYTWLPKAVTHIQENPHLFSDEDGAMVTLGVGKNMVRAIRFWAEVAGVAHSSPKGGWSVTEFERNLFGYDGYDPYLEDIQTLWLIHWKISSRLRDPLFAWHFLLNRWHRSEFSRSEVLRALRDEADRMGKKVSNVTLEHHFTTFLHTYVPTKGQKREVVEDNLDCPLVELELIQKTGERALRETSRREAVYAFRVEEKPEISPQLFAFCVHDYWTQRRANEKTPTLRDISVAEGSVGQIFKLPERDIRDRLEHLKSASGGAFEFKESAALQQIVRLDEPNQGELLDSVYGAETMP
jgi:uncharacterized protein DUF4007